MRASIIGLFLSGLASCALSCGEDAALGPNRGELEGSELATRTSSPPGVLLPSWGAPLGQIGDADLRQEAARAEASRDSHDRWFDAALGSEDVGVRRRALVGLARVGGARALTRLSRTLDHGGDVDAISAIALLEPPLDASGKPLAPAGPWHVLEDALWTRYAIADAQGIDGLLFAIARVGGPRSVSRLETLMADEDPGRRGAEISALALLCARGLPITDAGLVALGRLDGSLRGASAYALSRCIPSSPERLAGAEERDAMGADLAGALHGDPEDRLVWRAFAALGETPTEIPAEILGDAPPPWMTEVEAVRALGGSPAGRVEILRRLPRLDLALALGGPRVHVVLAALRALRSGAATDPAVTALLDVFGPRLDGLDLDGSAASAAEHHRRVIAHLRLELSVLRGISTGRLDALPRCDEPWAALLPPGYCETAQVEGIMLMSLRGRGSSGSASGVAVTLLVSSGPGEGDARARRERLDRLFELAEDPRPATAAPALSALTEVGDARAKTTLRAALASEDVGVRSAAAAAIATRSVDAEKRDLLAVPELLRLLRTSKNADAVEARLRAIEALGNLGRAARSALVEGGGRTVSTPGSESGGAWLGEEILALADDPSVAVRRQARRALLGHSALLELFDADPGPQTPGAFPVPGPLPPRSGLRLETTVGPISISFAGVDASINQENLAKLAQEGFFDGLQFHRVVPGFVVQGGDPRGDGYGGPGHLVPCEWSNLRYERGTVGIALAGKDTGGSQIFVAQAPQPHLDGRYTIVGTVQEGMGAVDRLLPGDRILGAEVLPPRGAEVPTR